MLFAVAIGVLSAIVILIVLARINIMRFMGYPAILDVVVTLALIGMLHGSYVGMVAAIIGGLFFSALITVIRRAYGYSRLAVVNKRLAWVTHEGKYYHIINQLFFGEKPCLLLKLPKFSHVLIACSLLLLFVV